VQKLSFLGTFEILETGYNVQVGSDKKSIFFFFIANFLSEHGNRRLLQSSCKLLHNMKHYTPEKSIHKITLELSLIRVS
jgi:hypothetical protein